MQALALKAFALICAISAVVSSKHLPEHEEHSGHVAVKSHHDAGSHRDKLYEHYGIDKYDYGHHYHIDEHGAAGYYWRIYKGEIPKDAIPGGKNVHGYTTYIGQVLYKDQLLPAKIDPEEKKVYFESGFKEYEAHKNIKILCTQHPEQFHWISTDSDGIHDLIDKHHLVEGGYSEEGVTLFIGRKKLPDELAVGKVTCTKDHTTLNITKDGVCVQHGDFEVLSYVGKKKAVLFSRSGATAYEYPEDKEKAININININK